MKNLGGAAAQALFGRPWLYCIPLSVTGLRLGEMVWNDAHEPLPIARSSSALALRAYEHLYSDVARRTENARRIAQENQGSRSANFIVPVTGAAPSYLRLPVLSLRYGLRPSKRVGGVAGYPRLIHEEERLRETLVERAEALSGASMLRNALITLPTHGLLRQKDFSAINRWFGG
jgi:hypothetical protein